jgi:hypothetical protein
MAVVQISRIQHRRGLQENLPQLSSAELGWSIDSQELYIGNGTIDEGAPEVGNTRILTQLDLEQIYQETIPNGTTANLASASFTANTPSVFMKYQIIRDMGEYGMGVKTGQMRISYYGTVLSYEDEYTETTDILCNLAVTNVGNTTAQVSAVSSASVNDSYVTYSFSTL